MKQRNVAVGIVMMVVIAGSCAWAQREAGATAPAAAAGEGRAREQGEARGREGGMPKELAALVSELNLTPEQQAQLTAKTQEMRTAMGNWEKTNQEKIGKLRADAQAGGREAAGKVRDQMHQLQDERAKMEADFQKQILDILTPDQRTAYAGLKVTQDPEFVGMLKDLQPSPELEAKLKDKAKEMGVALAKWDTENGEAMQQLLRQLAETQAALRPLQEQREKLLAEHKIGLAALLSPEQKSSLISARLRSQVLGRAPKGFLTDEQNAKIYAMCEQAVREAGDTVEKDPRAFEEMRNKISKAIRDEVLTAEQRTQIDAGGKR